MNDHVPSSRPSRIDPMRLTQAAQWTLREVAFRISLGFSEREVAIIHGESTRWVRQRLAKLREEIEGGR
jgi:predicted metal-dependent hydrolase